MNKTFLFITLVLVLTNLLSCLSACPSVCNFGIKKIRLQNGSYDCLCELKNPCQTKNCSSGKKCKLIFLNLSDRVFKTAVAVCILESKIIDIPTRLFSSTATSTIQQNVTAELFITNTKKTVLPKVNHYLFADDAFADNVIEVSFGGNVDLFCNETEENITRNSYWSKDELETKTIVDFNQTFSFNSHILQIRNFNKEDLGYYTCTLIESEGKVKQITVNLVEKINKNKSFFSSTKTRLNTNNRQMTQPGKIRLPIKVNVQPKLKSVEINDFVEFKCLIESPPSNHVNKSKQNLKPKWWHKHGDVHSKKSIDGNILRLAFVSETDGGEYTCYVTDEHGNTYEDTGALIVTGFVTNVVRTDRATTRPSLVTTLTTKTWKQISTQIRVSQNNSLGEQKYQLSSKKVTTSQVMPVEVSVKEGGSFEFSCKNAHQTDELKFEWFDSKLSTWVQITPVEKNGNIEKVILENLERKDAGYFKCSLSDGDTLRAVFVQITS